MKDNATKTDYIFLAIFGIGAVTIFLIELLFPSTQPNPKETALYNALELGLSLGFGWILQRIDSYRQFQENLKKFALSAYRRISDIEKSVNRIRSEINQMRLSYPKDKIHELDILRIVAEEMDNTVSSSIADWTDVIGDEISKSERIQELQTEQQILSIQKTSTAETNSRLLDLKNEIDRLRSELPVQLRSSIQNDIIPMEKSYSIVSEHFDIFIASESSILLKVNFYDNLSDDELKANEPYYLKVEGGIKRSHISVINKSGVLIGEVVNPFKYHGVPDEIFIDMVLRTITFSLNISRQDNEDEITSDTLSVVQVQYVSISPIYPYEFYIKVPINTQVAFRG